VGRRRHFIADREPIDFGLWRYLGLGDFQKMWDRACIAIGYSRPNPNDPKEIRAARTPCGGRE
jgi:hypothetical protein